MLQPELPIATGNTTVPNDVELGDLDGDGDLDAVVVSTGDNKVAWYENRDGLGNYGAQQVIASNAVDVTALHLADLDQDGDLDLLTGGASEYDSDVSWFENLGGGQFAAQQVISADVVGTGDVFAADLDGDGDLDVLSASRTDDKIAWYENLDGAGTFGEQNILSDTADGARSVVAGDLDGDGDVDIVAGSQDDDTVVWFKNAGDGTFGNAVLLTNTADYVTSVSLVDLDQDERLDVIITSRDDHSVVWFRNEGRGEFGPERLIALDSLQPYGVSIADFDGDGILDVAVADRLLDLVVWYPGLGDGLFDVPQVVGRDLDSVVSVAVGDVDGDGDADLLSASRIDNKVALFKNEGQGSFAAEVLLTEPGFLGAQYVGSGDVDGDGDHDVVAASFTGDVISWFENLDGRGTFGPEQVITTRVNGAEIVLLADLDGDGDNDAISASFADDKIAWYENRDGRGDFGPQRLISGDGNGPEYLAVGDIDGDGDLDVISASRYDGKIAWYPNIDGKGTFGFQVIAYQSTVLATFVDVGDIDGDGDLDIIANEYERTNSSVLWFENIDGEGTFGESNIITQDVELPTETRLADLDGDGDLDVIATSGDDGRLLWYENTNGRGDFDQGRLLSDSLDIPFTVRPVDLDNDGDLDLVAGDLGGNQIVWFENENGLGDFGQEQLVAEDVAGPSSLYIADLDGDGDPDVLASLTIADQIIWLRNGPEIPSIRGDFNGDNVVDVIDVDLICAAIETAEFQARFDLNGDGSLNRSDMNDMITGVLGTSFGDANLDGTFNSSDFVAVFQIGEYEDAAVGNSTWADGDWNCDGEFSTADLVFAFQGGGFVAASRPRATLAAAVDAVYERNTWF
jgi:hypothetical protein